MRPVADLPARHPPRIPVAAAPTTAVAHSPRVTRLGMAVRLYRAVSGQSVRECAKEMGIEKGTLVRLERGDNKNGMRHDHFLAVVQWLMQEHREP
jgi:hypothetical protein